MISTTSNDVIVLDVEKYPQVGEWGILIGTYLGLEAYHLADEYFKTIPQHITYLRYDSKSGIMGDRYWSEIRFQKSTYGVNEEGTTNKEKETIPDTIYSDYVIPYMKDVITLAIQEEFEHRHNVLLTKFSTLEEATWVDQICEATAYIADNSFETKLIHSLAEVRDLTTLEFATKIVDKQTEFKTQLYDLAVAEQKMIHIVTGCTTVRDLNVVLEDYFSIAMSNAQCLEYGRCTTNEETGNIERKETFDYSGGYKF
ncbi:MAG: hypothetical protein CMB29_04700 [Euryarchaeota archaeon]|nr:hypothetical protein [Euryarchaeota archaeon]